MGGSDTTCKHKRAEYDPIIDSDIFMHIITLLRTHIHVHKHNINHNIDSNNQS